MKKLISTPTNLGITLADAKMFLRVEHDIEDNLITSIIQSATLKAQGILGTQLTAATYQEASTYFSRKMPLFAPTQSITSVKYYDEAGVLQTVADTNYRLEAFGLECNIVFNDDFNFPIAQYRTDAVLIEYISGYLEIPPDIKMWIRIQVSTGYEFREQFSAGYGQLVEINPKFINQYLAPHRTYK